MVHGTAKRDAIIIKVITYNCVVFFVFLLLHVKMAAMKKGLFVKATGVSDKLLNLTQPLTL